MNSLFLKNQNISLNIIPKITNYKSGYALRHSHHNYTLIRASTAVKNPDLTLYECLALRTCQAFPERAASFIKNLNSLIVME